MAVIKRGKKWYITYRIKENGKTVHRMEVVGLRKDMAEVKLKNYLKLIQEGIDPKGYTDEPVTETVSEITTPLAPIQMEVLTIEQFKPTFLELHGKRLSKSMEVSYNTSFKHLLPVFGQIKLDCISNVMVRTYIADRKNEGASDSTVNKELACLKSACSRAFEWEYIKHNPLKGVRLLKEEPGRERYLTPEEANRLIEVSPTYLREIIIFALGTGMRFSEIMDLTWADVSLNEKQRSGNITVIGKGNKRRNIPINKTVFDLLVRKCHEKRSKLVFPSPKNGGRITNVKRSFATALEDAELEDFRFHDLRHTAASWMMQGGADLYGVQKILGHSSISTTQRYAHLSPRFLDGQIEVIDSFFSCDVKGDLSGAVRQAV
ncbi:MAG: site-specific integrase [Candidatus Latescibacterota bacterium]